MTTVGDILKFIEALAPRELKMDWDNVGLNCGSRTAPVTKIMVALDPFEHVCKEAADWGADLLVTHHPLIFRPIPMVTDEAAITLQGVDLLVLESNHDMEMLRSGPYPPYLKERIAGTRGHLSNDDAARFAVEMARWGTKEFVLAHLSRENNIPALALHAVQSALAAHGFDTPVSVAPRRDLSRYDVEVELCRR